MDLLPVGEELAELDLVVRQLDDGRLTVARDDATPDEGRITLRIDGERLVASLAVGPGEKTPELERTLGLIGGNGRALLRDGKVYFEAALSVASGKPPGRDMLRDLIEGIEDGALRARGELARAAAPAGAETAPTLVGAAGVPTQAIAPGGGPAGAPTIGTPVPVDDKAGLPSSFLRGAGQSGGETATQRYGRQGAVPGKAELSPEDRRASQRMAMASPAAAGSGGGMGIVIGLVVLLAAGGAGLFLLRGRSTTVVVAPPPPVQTTPIEITPAIDTEALSRPSDPGKSDPGKKPAGTTTPPTSTAQKPPPRPKGPSEQELLADAKDPAKRLAAVERWVQEGHDAAEGARGRLLAALDATALVEPKLDRALARSVGQQPPTLAEADDLLARGGPALRRAVATHLLGAQDKDAAEKLLLAHVKDDPPELPLEETLVKLGRPREGAAGRLVAARGSEWALWGEGGQLLEELGKQDCKQLAPLLSNADPEVKKLACGLLVKAQQPNESLKLLTAALKDADASVRQRAVEALVAVGDPRCCWPLARALVREEARQVKDALRDSLQRLPTKETVQLLDQLRAQPTPADRRAAVAGLAATKKVEAVPSLVKALEDADREVRLEALRALEALYNQPDLRPTITEGLAAIRKIGLDRTDRDAQALAQKLHMAITGRMPDAGMRGNR